MALGSSVEVGLADADDRTLGGGRRSVVTIAEVQTVGSGHELMSRRRRAANMEPAVSYVEAQRVAMVRRVVPIDEIRTDFDAGPLDG